MQKHSDLKNFYIVKFVLTNMACNTFKLKWQYIWFNVTYLKLHNLCLRTMVANKGEHKVVVFVGNKDTVLC